MAERKTGTVHEMKIKQLKKTAFISVVLATVIISFALVFLKFLFDLWVYNNQVQAVQRETLATLETNIDIYEALQEDFEVLQSAQGNPEDPDTDIVLDALPDNYDFPALASSVQRLANLSGIELTNFSGTDEESSAPEANYNPEPYEMLFSVEIRGDYEDIQVFINTLDLSIRPFQIGEIEMRGSDESMTVDISLITYFQPEKTLDYPERTVQ